MSAHALVQSEYPVSHFMPHVPDMHVACPLAGVVQTFAHPAQLLTSVRVLMHSLLQLAYSVLHAMLHVPDMQAARPFVGIAHAEQSPARPLLLHISSLLGHVQVPPMHSGVLPLHAVQPPETPPLAHI
jgi:hypothetical protein